MVIVIEYVMKIMDKVWDDYSYDNSMCRRWMIVWATLVIITGLLAFWFNVWFSVAEGLFIPALIAEIRHRGVLYKDRGKLVKASADMLAGATNQLLIEERLRREKLSERLED